MIRKIPLCLTLVATGGMSVAVLATVGEPPVSLQDATPFDDGRTIERSIGRGDEHRYQLPLKGGDYAAVIVDQQGIDVTVQVRAADGRAIAEFNDEIRTRGEERVEIAADIDHVYTIAVQPRPDSMTPGSYTIRVGERRLAIEADRLSFETRRLRTSAMRLDDDGQFAAAASQLERALTLVERARGSDDLQVAAVAAQLAGVYRTLPNNSRSESLFARAIAIMDRTLGAGHPMTAFVRSRLALLYQNTGQRARAEALLRPALEVLDRTVGAENRWYVSGLVTLATLRADMGDYDGDEEIIRRALALLDKSGDTRSNLYASLLNNLGEVYRHREDLVRAEEFYRRALAISEDVFGDDNYFNATALQNLGIVARERKDYPTAEAYYQRALSIRERRVGAEHPDIAQLLNNLAIIYRLNGDPQRSLDTHLRALHIWEHAAGPYQQATLLSVGNIARTYGAMDDLRNAIVYQRRVDALVEKQLALNLAVGSERQKLAFVRNIAERTDRTISLNVVSAPDDPDAARLGALVLLQRKGRVLDAMTDAFAATRLRVPDQTDQALLDQLKATTAQLARVALAGAAETRQDERERTIRDLEARKEQLETTLSEHSAAFRAQMQPITLEAVQAAVPADTALLEFAIFRPFDPHAERNAEAYGAPHYAAYVVRRYGAPRGVDLGEARAIDAAVDLVRRALRDPKRTDYRDHARALDALVVRPLARFVGDARRLLVSPDGDLNLVPFEALVDESGRFLVERYAISYLTSGRDLVRMQAMPVSRSAAVILADPLFGEPAPVIVERPLRHDGDGRGLRTSVTAGEDLSRVYFAPLAATAEEARAIKALFPEATLLTGRQATKAALQQVNAPRMLHIASHGFFLEDAARAASRSATGAPPAADSSRTITASLDVENPLLRSGLALAGANLEREAHGDGILTALEASGLNLWGTQLVTLSACDTGVGEVRNGEGVYGLRRAFVLAGTETLVMSLWPVSDSVARETMVAYYTGLRAGLGRGDALRQAKLALLRRKTREHPFYWASFIQSGDWTSLNRARALSTTP